MKFLLDTHVWIWLLANPQNLSTAFKEKIEGPGTELWLSPISIWETMILAEKKRISLQPNPSQWVRQALGSYPFREAPINHEISIKSREIDLPHRDPADRFLAATALIYELTLVTADKHLQSASWLSTMKV